MGKEIEEILSNTIQKCQSMEHGCVARTENQVVECDLSKRLEEEGYPQEGLYYWTACGTCLEDITLELLTDNESKHARRYVAPTVAELGEALPVGFIYKNDAVQLTIWKEPTGWFVRYTNNSDAKIMTYSESEADARALMWIKLKEQDLI